MPRMWSALAVRMAARLWHAFIMKPSVHTSAQSRCRWNEHRITETEKTISLTHPRTTTADISRTPEHTGNMSNGVEAAVCKQKSVHRSCRKSDRKREGQLLFLIVHVSYNARYAKLREAKNAYFPDFWRSSLSWLIFRLSSAVLHILQFLSYFMVLMVLFVSCLQMLPVLCAAASVHFIPVSIYVRAL